MRYIYIFFLFIISCSNNKATQTKLTGFIYGTSYKIIYFSENDINYKYKIDSLFNVIDNSMSTYKSNSIISRINNNIDTKVDLHFEYVFNISKDLHNKTNGLFDPSIGPLVNYLNFGPNNNYKNYDDLKNLIGFDNFELADGLVKRPNNSFLDFNAIAKGYSVDIISDFLDKNNVSNYLVEVGGEIKVKGKNLKKNIDWKVGLDKPRFDGLQMELYNSFSLIDKSMATSGIYRKFKIDSLGNRYAHIINPKTGYSSKTNILSVTVISDNCIIADAYATALHLMTIDEIKNFTKMNNDISVFVIYLDEKNNMKDISFNNFPII
jgi:thiamine biosynthesis lipoprotein